MFYGVLDKPEAAELERFAEYLLGGLEICTEQWDDNANDGEGGYVRFFPDEREVADLINEYLRHGDR